MFYHESQESKMIPLLMNSISMKGVLVIMNTVTTVSARLVVFSLALDMYRLSAFLGKFTLIEVRVLVVCNKIICQSIWMKGNASVCYREFLMLQFSLPCAFDSLCCLSQMNKNMRVQNEHYDLKMKDALAKCRENFLFSSYSNKCRCKKYICYKTSGYGHVNKLQILCCCIQPSFVTSVIWGENLFNVPEYIHDTDAINDQLYLIEEGQTNCTDIKILLKNCHVTITFITFLIMMSNLVPILHVLADVPINLID